MNVLGLIVLGMVWGAVMTPVSIALSNHYGMMDYPDDRKLHHTPMPRGAGIVLWSGLTLWALLFPEVTFELRMVLTGATIVFYAGYIDDMFSLSPFGRLAAHFAAAALFVPLSGQLGFMRIGILIVWIAGVTNAYNFIDGLNGLSLTMSILCLTFLGALSGNGWVIPAASIAAGMFFWNFPVAHTFVGDGGVYLLGYYIAMIAALWLREADFGLIRFVVLLLLIGGVPVIDTLCAITRRLAAGKSPFYPDRSHVHHRLLDHGYSPVRVLATLGLLQTGSLCAAWLIAQI
jgi:UDP-GlcNAc:undecaprenyl-phosphate GlcNAc-1-phosphate transferase